MTQMDKQFISKEEFELVKAIRQAPKYSDFEVMKRPTAENPDGTIVRVTTKTSLVIHSEKEKVMV